MAQNVGNYILCHFYFLKLDVECMRFNTCQVSKNLEFMLDKGIFYLYNDLACIQLHVFTVLKKHLKNNTGGEK